MRSLIFVVLIGCLSGCATQDITLWVYSQPPGAFITELSTGKAQGTTPIGATYNRQIAKNYHDKDGCFIVKGYEARWVSGARSVTTDPIHLCGNYVAFNITISRDSAYPDLEKDLQFALQLQQQATNQQVANAQQRTARAQEQANRAAILNSIYYKPKTTNCTMIGNNMNCSSY